MAKMTEELFAQAFKRYGNPWQASTRKSSELDPFSHILRLFRQTIGLQKGAIGAHGPIYCNLIENNSFNALATNDADHEFVTIFSGAINTVSTMYFAMLSDPNALQSIGNSSEELHHSAHGEDLTALRLPRNRQRQLAAWHLSIITCVFMLLHEVGHIVRCHPVFLASRYGIRTYEELPKTDSTAELSRIRMALEWEADEYGAVASYQFISALHDNNYFGEISYLKADYLWAIAIAMMFCLVGVVSKGGMWQNSRSHPAPVHRCAWSMAAVQNAFESSASDSRLEAGLQDVGNWVKRHLLGTQLYREKFAPDMLVSHKETVAELGAIQSGFANERPLLKRLVSARNDAAETWRAKGMKG